MSTLGRLWYRYRPRLALWLDVGFAQVGTHLLYECEAGRTFNVARLYVMVFGRRIVEFQLWRDRA